MTVQGDPTVVYDGLGTRGPFTFEDLGSITFDKIAELGLTFHEIGMKNVIFVNGETGAGATISDVLADVDIVSAPPYVIHPLQGVTYAIAPWDVVDGMPVATQLGTRVLGATSVSITASSTKDESPLAKAVPWPGAATVSRFLPDPRDIGGTGVWSPRESKRGAGSVATKTWGPGWKEPGPRLLDDALTGSRFVDFVCLEPGQRLIYNGLDGRRLDGFAAHAVITSGLVAPPSTPSRLLVLQEITVASGGAVGSTYPCVCLDSRGRVVVVQRKVATKKVWDPKKKKQVVTRYIATSTVGTLDSRITSGAVSVIGVSWVLGGNGVHLCTATVSGKSVVLKSKTVGLGTGFINALTANKGSRLCVGSSGAVGSMRGAALDMFELTHVGARSKGKNTGVASLEAAVRALHAIYRNGGRDVA